MEHATGRSTLKHWLGRLITTLIFVLLLTITALAAEDTVTIKGNGVAKEVSFSRAELEKMTTQQVKTTFSSTNNFPTDKDIAATGVKLSYLLEQAGVKAEAKQIRVVASDGYEKTFTYQELMKDQRYTFSGGKQAAVEPIIAYQSGDDSYLKLMMGQRIKGEQTTPWFVKMVATIEVTTEEPQQWQSVSFVKEDKGTELWVTPNHQSLDRVKIYYTTDGSDPTINSSLYNVSATYYQPELNKAIVLKQNAVVKAIAIGPGKKDSQVASVTAALDGSGTAAGSKEPTGTNGATSSFDDLAGYEWAADSIKALAAKSIINGAGNGKFQPQNNLKRSEFAKMMVLALGQQPATTGSTFSDVKQNAWYYGYVERAAALGLISGYEDGTFRPDQALSKEEMITIVVNTFNQENEIKNLDQSLLEPFKQEKKISNWAKNNVAYAESINLLEHGHMVISSGNFLYLDGKAAANRAEAATLVQNMLTKK